MKNNKGFAPILIIIAVLAVLAVGSVVYFSGKHQLPKTQILSQSESQEGLLEYVNNEAGFSFKYPKKFGEVDLRPVDVQLGNGYQVTVGVPGKYYFYFEFYTKGYVVGDSLPVTKWQETKNCDAPYSSCESITLNDGTVVKLRSEIGYPGTDFNTYSFRRPLDTSSKYLGVSFYSNFDSSILVDIASTLKVFPPKNSSASDKTDSIEGYISSHRVGLFHIGEPAPDETSLSQTQYSIRETTIFPEGDPQKQFIISKSGKDLLTFELSPDMSKIWDITVISSEFKTKEGVGTGSTISDFIKAYPNYKFWYSEAEGEHFVLNTSNGEASPQFILDRSGLINPGEIFNYPTHRQPKISDFKTSGKIVSVRVYFRP